MKAFPPSPEFRRDPFYHEAARLRGAMADLLREVRLAAPLTMSEVSRRSGLSRPAVSFLENQAHEARVSTLWRVSRAVEIASWELLREAERRAFGR